MSRAAADAKKRRIPLEPALFLCLLLSGTLLGMLPGASPAVRADAAPSCGVAPGSLAPRGVAAVIDGDTLRLDNGDRVRIIGVNTPEWGRDGRPSEALARAATARLQAFIGQPEQVLVVPGRDPKDRYGRRLAHVFDLSGNSLAEQQLRAGMGFHVAIAPNFAYLDCLRSAEAEAVRAGIGVWVEPAYRAVSAAELADGQAGFVRIRDRVTRVSFKDNGWWVQLGGRVGLQIKPDAQFLFRRADLRKLDGAMVEARGWLVAMRGDWWLLQLGHPAMLRPAH